jgi:general secretion pathway protein K
MPIKPAIQKPPQEEGAALLSVLLLVAVMAVIAATALDRLQLSTKLAANSASMAQARQYSYAAETIATARIEDLLAREPEQTTLAGDWMGRDIPVPIDGGIALARIQDADNCFNLNSLVFSSNGAAYDTAASRNSGAITYAANILAIDQFANLMSLLQVPDNEAKGIAQAAADWVDSDSSALPGGAEDEYYRGLANPYLPGNRLMADRSELNLVKGMTPAIYNRIKPWICALPRAELTAINPNTMAPDQSVLLAMLFGKKLSIAEAKAYLANRPKDGYGSVVRFWAAPRLAALETSATIRGQIRLKSRYFQLRTKITTGDIDLESHALIDASTLPARITGRYWGEEG